jgi:hypothetical protein
MMSALDSYSHAQFRDFVCTLLQNVAITKQQTATLEHKAYDKQWNNIIPIELIPHPNLKHKQAVEMDYAMTDGSLQLEVRGGFDWLFTKAVEGRLLG